MEPLSGRLHPIEIAKRLSRELQSSKEVSINKTYVPNYFEIKLNPVDYAPLKSIGTALTKEILEYLIKEASEKDYHFAEPPQIKLLEDSGIKKWHFEIKSSFFSGEADAAGFLEITEGFEKGKTFFLKKDRYMIGRGNDAAIIIGDPKISKLHAEIYWEENTFTIEDRNSKNGTMVNGNKIGKIQLNDKDIITLGFTTIKFNVLK